MMKRMIMLLLAAGAAAMAGFGPTSCAGPECGSSGFTDAEIAVITAAGPEGFMQDNDTVADIRTYCKCPSAGNAGNGLSEDETSDCPPKDKAAECIMRVFSVNDSLELAVLRAHSTDLPAEALCSENFRILSERMLRTVTHPSQDGVGIAAPQVGINRRVIAVQRFDKPGKPFEVYANIRIVSLSDSVAVGREGCLSVPGKSGYVERSQEIVIEYADVDALRTVAEGCSGNCRWLRRPAARFRTVVPMVTDTVRGFTAVIFQHETDHLEGILYTDKATGIRSRERQ